MVERTVGCELAGRDLGSTSVKVDLIFHGGSHFAGGIPSRCDSFCLYVPDGQPDERPESPRLTLPREVSSLLKIIRDDDAVIQAALFHTGCCEGSAIALGGTERGALAVGVSSCLPTADASCLEKMWDFAAVATNCFDRALRNMK